MTKAPVLLALIVAALTLFGACTSEDPTTALEQNRALVQRFYEEFDANPSLDVIDRWLAPDYRSHEAGAGKPLDLAAYRESLMPFLEGFTEIHHDVRQMVAEGDRVALLVDISMKHTGEFAGLTATGRTVAVSEMVILRLSDGKLAEEWILFDGAGLMQQLQSAAPMEQ